MQRQQITVTITPDGRATVTVSGVSGPSCKALTKGLERALGATTETRDTAEYYETPLSINGTLGLKPE